MIRIPLKSSSLSAPKGRVSAESSILRFFSVGHHKERQTPNGINLAFLKESKFISRKGRKSFTEVESDSDTGTSFSTDGSDVLGNLPFMTS